MAGNISQVRRLVYNDEEIGMGFNSDSGLAVGTALDFTPPAGEVSQESQGDVLIITSHEELMDSLNISAQLQGRYAFASAGMKMDFVKSTQFNSSSTFVVAKALLGNTIQRGHNFRLKADLQHLLDTDEDGFKKAFGDSFVR